MEPDSMEKIVEKKSPLKHILCAIDKNANPTQIFCIHELKEK